MLGCRIIVFDISTSIIQSFPLIKTGTRWCMRFRGPKTITRRLMDPSLLQACTLVYPVLNYLPPQSKQSNDVKGRGNGIHSQEPIDGPQMETNSQHSGISSRVLSGTTTVAVGLQSLPATTTIPGRGESVPSCASTILSERTNSQCPRRATSPSKLCT